MLWGASTAAYQIEGSWNVSGKQPSIWDVMTHTCSGCVANNDTGDVADDSYARYAEDTELLANLSLNAYRFSISWPRIITAEGKVNPLGVAHYSDAHRRPAGSAASLRSSLCTTATCPSCTTRSRAAASSRAGTTPAFLLPLFLQYATTCFAQFGQRVKHWITLNEPRYFCELYGCGHTAILVHANTVAAYRSLGQDGVIGMVIDGSVEHALHRQRG